MTDLTTQTNQPITSYTGSTVDAMIAAWLSLKGAKSQSAKTVKAYADTIADFRSYLLASGYDLLDNSTALTLAAQEWSQTSKVAGKQVAQSTINQRLAIVSSFYKYLADRLPNISNPIKADMRVSVETYSTVKTVDNVAERLGAIERWHLDGKRDYALLVLALTTGRRLSEIAALTIGDLTLNNDKLTIVWKRVKGGKQMRDTLSAAATKAMLDYLYEQYGKHVFKDTPTSNPVWVNYSKRYENASKDYPRGLSIQALDDIVYKHMHVNFHALRHTFAHTMETKGALVSEIQSKLGHKSLSTTSIYLAALKSADNSKADDLADAYGLE
jgi:site-specific recombinase XerD